MSEKKILYILPIEEKSYGLPFARRQIRQVEKSQGYKVKIFYYEKRRSVFQFFKAAVKLRQLVNSFQPDISHAHYGSINGLLAGFFSRKPLVITFHGSDLNKTPSDGWLGDRMARLFSNITALTASKIIVVSPPMIKNLWWKRKGVEIIPMGTDSEEFYPIQQTEAREKLKDEFEFGNPTILFNGNNPAIKRTDIAEEAVRLLMEDFPQSRILKVEGNIEPQRMPWVVNACDVLILCSNSEGSPAIIKEAMACNLPIVATRVGDVAERIKGVYEARIVEQNPKAIAEGIKEVLILDHFKFNGRRELIRQGLDESALLRKLLKIYANL
jgi:glycosyltransferase involved in cell wall biosynthesis